MSPWDAGSIFPVADMWIAITSRNHQTNEFTGRWFGSQQEASKWLHDVSLEQMPAWHKENCQAHGCRRLK